MVEKAQPMLKTRQCIDPDQYKVSLKANLKGSTTQIFLYLRNLIKNNEGWPGYKAKILRQYQPDRNLSAIIDYKEDSIVKNKDANRF